MSNNIPPAVTDVNLLKDHPAMARLAAWKTNVVKEARFDRDELTVVLDRTDIREACTILRPEFNFFSDLTCTDWFPTQPRFHVIYHLLSHKLKERVRLKVTLTGEDPVVESITSVWPAANFFEREIFDLFGVRFLGHPDLRRIVMPDDWEGNPLRKDYPVEGYR